MNMRPNFIVLSGIAGAGKDSVANILVNDHRWTLYSLAGPLKRFSQDMFGFTDEQVFGPSSARNRPDPRWARPCLHCKKTGQVRSMLRFHECSACNGKGIIDDNSPRRILQLLGEEYLRQMIHVDALTMRARPEIEKLLFSIDQQGFGGIVINDARNDNDRDNMNDWLGACRVDVRSTKVKDRIPETWHMHKSELRQPNNADVEYVLNNDEEWPFPSLHNKVDLMLASLRKKCDNSEKIVNQTFEAV